MLALQQSEVVRAPLLQALEAAPWPALLLDATARILHRNKAATTLLQARAPRTVKRRLSSYLQPGDRTALRHALVAAAKHPVSTQLGPADAVWQCHVWALAGSDSESLFVVTLGEPITDALVARCLSSAATGCFAAVTPQDFVAALRHAFAPMGLAPRVALDADPPTWLVPRHPEHAATWIDDELPALLRSFPAAQGEVCSRQREAAKARTMFGAELDLSLVMPWDDRCLLVRLPLGNGRSGCLALSGPGTLAVTDGQLQPFAALLGLALGQLLQREDARREQERTAGLLAAYEALAAADDLPNVLRAACEHAARLSDGAVAAVLLPDPDGLFLRCAMARGPASDLLLGQRCALSGTLIGEVWRSGPQAVNDVREQDLPLGVAWDRDLCRGAALLPLGRDQRRRGVLALTHPKSGHFDDALLRVLEQLGRNVAVAIEHALLHETIRRSEERYRTLFQNALEIVILLDLDGRVLSGNRAALRFLGLSPAELQARSLDIRDVLPDHAAARLADLRRRALDGDVPVAVEIEIRCVDGSLALLETTIQALHENGQPVGVYLIGRDITERRQLEAQVRQGEKLAALGQLVAGAAHELNNPLAVVLGTTQLLLHDLQAAEWIEDIRNIETAAQRAKHIVKQMLTFAREHDEVRAAIDVRLLIERGLQNVRPELQRHAIEARVELQADLPSMWGDAYQLEQVLDNLLHNAIHVLAVSQRAPRRITLAAAATGQRVRLCVADNGPGIPPHVLPRIFDPFFTTKDVGAGTGLGLSLVYGIVEKHGGTVHAESVVGEGATFVVELPLGRPAATEARTAVLKHAANSTILIVEDEADVRGLLERALAQHGYAVTAVSSAEAALQELDRQAFDLVITDLRMAGLSGKELYERVRLRQPQLSWVFVTGDTMSSSSDSFLRQAGVPVLGKPFTLDELWEAVATSIVGQRQQPRAA